MPNDRNLADVITATINLIPKNDPLHMKFGLTDILDSVIYSAPENIEMWWQQFCLFINEHMPYPPIEKWHYDVFKLITTKDYIPENN